MGTVLGVPGQPPADHSALPGLPSNVRGLTEEAAKAKISVTVAGAPAEHIVCTVENGTITLRNTSGTVLFFR